MRKRIGWFLFFMITGILVAPWIIFFKDGGVLLSCAWWVIAIPCALRLADFFTADL